jgi:hypothetical protein
MGLELLAGVGEIGFEGVVRVALGGEIEDPGGLVAAVAVAVPDGVVEDRKEPVVILLGDRVELVVVALGARDGEAEKGGAVGVDTVEHGLDAELLGVDATLLVDLGVAIEAGGDALGDRCVGEEVAGELFDRELIVGQVAIEGGDDPVAIFPNLARGIDRCSRWSRRSGRGRATVAPSVRRSAGRRAGARRGARRRRGASQPRNAETSAGVGGRPVRSRLIRRSKETRSASGATERSCPDRGGRE